VSRWGVGKITNLDNGNTVTAVVLGHDRQYAIFMAYDMREALDLKKDSMANLQIERVSLFGKLRWYLCTPDPAVHVPAWLAFWSVVLGLLGLGLGLRG
jgi:hypothetical protein